MNENEVYAKLLYLLLTIWESSAADDENRRNAGKAIVLFRHLYPDVAVTDEEHEFLSDVLE